MKFAAPAMPPWGNVLVLRPADNEREDLFWGVVQSLSVRGRRTGVVFVGFRGAKNF